MPLHLPALAALFLAALLGNSQSSTVSDAILERGLAAAASSLRVQADRSADACRDAGPGRWPGLTLERGRVAAAAVIQEIDGYAKTAATTGGLGGELAIVTTTRDYDPSRGEAAIPGSLRSAVERAARERVALWIVFHPGLGPGAVIHPTQPFRLPDNITLDGSCSDLTFESPSDVGHIYVFGARNVIVYRLAFRKSDYRSTANEGDAESAIRLNGLFDRVAILHNDLARCGDGCIDITTSPRHPLPVAARVTVAFNLISDHDKTMLFGTFTCGEEGLPRCDPGYVSAHRDLPPAFFLTLEGNLFLRTSQRHPRVFGRVMAHVVNNVMALAPMSRDHGPVSDCNAIFVSNAARALVEQNLFIPLGRQRTPFRAVWTTITPGAERMPDDTEGFIRLEGNTATLRSILAGNHPELVPEPVYPRQPLALHTIAPHLAVACVAARAGRHGAAAWDERLCPSLPAAHR